MTRRDFLLGGTAAVALASGATVLWRMGKPAAAVAAPFEISKTGQSGIRICHGDTIMYPKLPALNYGQTFQRDGFTCKSEPSGVTCFNADRHGFSISRNTQSVF